MWDVFPNCFHCSFFIEILRFCTTLRLMVTSLITCSRSYKWEVFFFLLPFCFSLAQSENESPSTALESPSSSRFFLALLVNAAITDPEDKQAVFERVCSLHETAGYFFL